jgi:hypothetical protein
MRLKPSHLVIAVVIAAVLLAVAGVVYMDQKDQARERRAKAADRSGSAPSRPSGRELCMQHCAAAKKGYIYRAEQRIEEAGRSRLVPAACRCIGRNAQ